MARDARIEARLQRWAQWVTVGDASGYPTMNVLHVNWSPPAGGQMPSMPIGSIGDAPQTHRLIAQLSARLANTLVAHYCMRWSPAEVARRMACSERTVFERIERAHGQLAGLIDLNEVGRVSASCSEQGTVRQTR